MRIDSLAYQQAVRVAGIGLLLQIAIGLTLLVYGRLVGDTTLWIASLYALAGIPIWLGLIVVFHQHRLERLEALEGDELAAARAVEGSALFEKEGARVAARRLRMMHTWLMPAISLFVAALLVTLGWLVLDYFRSQSDPNRDILPFASGGSLGWKLAICIGLALVAFIFSRFVAGMSKQPAWQNLRGGAGYMVGNALVLLAVAIGIVFHFFQRPAVLEGIAYAIGIFMIAVAAEIVLNFILNLYRPRRVGETPRPAFDSRVLSLFAAPDSIVRSINEAVNYQFGFDITSSWGYQLLLRSTGRLIAAAVIVLIALSAIVVVEPGEQAIRLRFGRPVGGVYEAQTMLKLPWPFETSQVYDVGHVRELVLGKPPATARDYRPWGDEGQLDPNRNLFLVAAGPRAMGLSPLGLAVNPVETAAAGAIEQFALVDADIILNYRVKDGKLAEWLSFANDAKSRRGTLDSREKALRDIAMRDVTQHLSTQPLAEVLSPSGDSLIRTLRDRIQTSFDRLGTGVEVVSVSVPRLRPPGAEAGRFVERSIAVQNARRMVEQARSVVNTTMGTLLGDPARASEVVAEIERLPKGGASVDSPEAIEQRIKVERLMLDPNSQTASVIAGARARRWTLHMEARENAYQVLGEAPSWNAAPELYRQRRTMEVLKLYLPNVRVKYLIGLDPDRVKLDVEMRDVEAGLNLGDYIEKKDDTGSSN